MQWKSVQVASEVVLAGIVSNCSQRFQAHPRNFRFEYILKWHCHV